MASELTLTSTTDSEADVRTALGLDPTPPPASTEPPATPAPEATPDASPAKTPESDAGRTLAHKRTKLQGRIGKLQAERKAAAAERDEAIRAKARVEAEFEAFKRGQTATPPLTPVVPVPVVASAPTPEPKEDDFATYSEYTKALTKWAAQDQATNLRAEIDAKIARERQAQQQAARDAEAVQREQARRDTFFTRVEGTKAKHADYDTVIAQSRDIALSQPMTDVIHDSEQGGELLYYFATNPAEAERMRVLDAAVQLRELGKLEDRSERGLLFNEPSDDTPPPPASVAPSVPVSRAPAPLPRVGGSAVAQSKDPSQMSHAEFKEWRARNSRRVAGRR